MRKSFFKIGRTPKRASRIIWSFMIFAAIGYFPTMLLADPRASIAIAMCAVIPYGSKSRGFLQAAFRGLLLGLLAAIAIAAGLEQARKMPVSDKEMLFYIAALGGMCTTVSVLFAYLAKLRKARIEEQWK